MKEIVNAEDIHRMRKEKDTYEDHTWNNLILTYFKAPADPEGCLLFDRITDRKQWETFSRSNERLLEKFRTVSAWPRKMEVRRIPYA